jgi:hypothetical protein
MPGECAVGARLGRRLRCSKGPVSNAVPRLSPVRLHPRRYVRSRRCFSRPSARSHERGAMARIGYQGGSEEIPVTCQRQRARSRSDSDDTYERLPNGHRRPTRPRATLPTNTAVIIGAAAHRAGAPPATRSDPRVKAASDTFGDPWPLGGGHRPRVVQMNAMVIRGAEPIVVDTGCPIHRDGYLDDLSTQFRAAGRAVGVHQPQRHRPCRQPAPGDRCLPAGHVDHHLVPV